LRVVVLALLLAPITAYWSVDQSIDIVFSLMIPPVVMTLLVATVNLGVRRIAPRLALTEGELLLFYAMHAVMGALCAEWMDKINPFIHTYAVFDDSISRGRILPYAHPWFFVPLKDAPRFADYRRGGYGLGYFLAHLPLWGTYIAAWTLLVSLVCVAMLCINCLMRDAWTRHERLTFPIVQIPMDIARIGSGQLAIWRSRLFVGVFLTMLLIDLLNGLHFLYPALPYINVRYLGDAQTLFFTSEPYSAIGWTPISLFPYMAVIGFFVPSDLLFSCVFFFWVRKCEQICFYSLGYTQSAGVFAGAGFVPDVPYFSEQSWGAFLALFALALWSARGHLREVWRQIRHGGSGQDSGISHRAAFLGLLASVAALCILGSVVIGLSFPVMAFTLALFLVFSTALTRLRAQTGVPIHEMAVMGPNQLLVDLVGNQTLAQSDVTRLVTTFHFMNHTHRTHPMPHQLEAMKMTESERVSPRTLLIALLIAILAGSVLGHLMTLYDGYHDGAQNRTTTPSGIISTLFGKRRDPNAFALLALLAGFAGVLLLDRVRFLFPGFILHPVGYALAMNYGIDYIWFGLLVVWLIKGFITRYWGRMGQEWLRQAALGIILAEFCAETIWTLYSITHHHQLTYSVSINSRFGWNQ
jgi:hypothetical protein